MSDPALAPPSPSALTRRGFSAAGLSASLAACATTAPAAGVPSPTGRRAYLFFSPEEAAFVEASCDALIPPGGDGPGATEAGVPVFLDRALFGAYGTADGTYQRGPFRQGSPEQGYQLPAEPAGFYRIGIADADVWCRGQHGARFTDLAQEARVQALTAMQAGKASFATIPAALFFGTYWFDVRAGYFSDPVHGGNRDMAAWRMIGFPGAETELRRFVGVREPIFPEPVSLEQTTRRA